MDLGQVSRRVGDTAAAVAWYRDVLGLHHLYTVGDHAFFDCGGVRLSLGPGEGAGTPASILSFRVPDIRAATDVLAARGVVFEGEPHVVHMHPDGVEEWMVFFADPDGNLLALMAHVRPGD